MVSGLFMPSESGERAKDIATRAHEGQVDKAGMPYIDHPRRVAERVAQVDGRPEAIAVAWLHDVVEDTGTTLDDLRAGEFSEEVVAAVDAMTRCPDAGDEYYQRIATDDLAIVVKLADIWDNTDPDRVARLDEKDRTRLQDKYRHALEVIAGAAPQVDPWTMRLRAVVVNGIHSHLSARREPTAPSASKARTSAFPPDWSATTPSTSTSEPSGRAMSRSSSNCSAGVPVTTCGTCSRTRGSTTARSRWRRGSARRPSRSSSSPARPRSLCAYGNAPADPHVGAPAAAGR